MKPLLHTVFASAILLNTASSHASTTPTGPRVSPLIPLSDRLILIQGRQAALHPESPSQEALPEITHPERFLLLIQTIIAFCVIARMKPPPPMVRQPKQFFVSQILQPLNLM
jgi:hypothetical protein